MMHCQTAEKKSSSSTIDQEVEAPALAHDVSVVSVTKEKPTASGQCKGKQAAAANAAVSSESSSKTPKIEELEQCNEKLFYCPECGKDFEKEKAVYGHLRSHPERSYRGSKPPRKEFQQDLPKWSLKGKRVRNNQKTCLENEADSEMLEAAEILLEFSNPIDDANKDLVITERGESSEKEIEVEEFVRESNSPEKKGGYLCAICNRSFTSYQALGGHKSSHGKIKIKKEADRVEGVGDTREVGRLKCKVAGPTAVDGHKCRVCGNVFSSGPALGGHMRSHMSSVAVPPIQITEGPSDRSHAFDLNETAPEEAKGAYYPKN